MIRSLILAGCLVVSQVGSLRAQTDTLWIRQSPGPLVLDHEFTASGEFVQIFLQDRQVYRAELSSPDVTLEIRGVSRSIQAPRIYRVFPALAASGSSLVEIHPGSDAVYQIRAVALMGSAVATRLRLYRDLSASERRQLVSARPGWQVGVEFAGGWHSAFVQSSAPAPTGTEIDGGSDIEGCLTARYGQRFTLCVTGLDHQSQHGARNILWVYTEPRVGILGRGRSGQSGWDLGVLLRFGVGMISAYSATPTVLSPGLYLSRQLHRGSSSGTGWSLRASYSRSFFRGFTRPFDATGETVTPKSHRVSLGIGWYR
jgi:hypothetical protein